MLNRSISLRASRLALLAFVVIVAACGPSANPTPASPVTTPCTNACDALFNADCAEGRPTPQGLTCAQLCERSSTLLHWPLDCWAKAKTRADILACGGVRCLDVNAPKN